MTKQTRIAVIGSLRVNPVCCLIVVFGGPCHLVEEEGWLFCLTLVFNVCAIPRTLFTLPLGVTCRLCSVICDSS